MEIVKNLLIPQIATVKKIINETTNIISLQIVLDDNESLKNFKFEPGQFGQISVFGVGESTFVINSSPLVKEYLQFSVMKTGVNTTAIHNLSEGEKVGLRAPLGNWFPYKDMEGRNILFIAGGIGAAPLRPLIFYIIENKNKYKNLTLLYAARTPEDFCFQYDINKWKNSGDIKVIQTIDNACYGWQQEVGLCPDILEKLKPSFENTVAVVCGPPIMIKYTIEVLKKLKFSDEAIYTTLERRMKCGIGKCGRCNIGEKFVCTDGPVFSLKELNKICENFI
ncbi:MAG: FAD/NAD(P)-binding protein [Actinobacteria bacterium]|nr:FAD/NAD(P)-binding protein [Cyanobacteriota bacterium]MCL5771550.1 FAD/NAD(P)-binding protein [Actinomycetota bacterium]